MDRMMSSLIITMIVDIRVNLAKMIFNINKLVMVLSISRKDSTFAQNLI